MAVSVTPRRCIGSVSRRHSTGARMNHVGVLSCLPGCADFHAVKLYSYMYVQTLDLYSVIMP